MTTPQTLPVQAGAAPKAAPQGHAASLHALVLQSLDDDQAVDVISIPLEGKSSVADYMVIASGRSTRQVAAIAQKLAEQLWRATSIVAGHPYHRVG